MGVWGSSWQPAPWVISMESWCITPYPPQARNRLCSGWLSLPNHATCVLACGGCIPWGLQQHLLQPSSQPHPPCTCLPASRNTQLWGIIENTWQNRHIHTSVALCNKGPCNACDAQGGKQSKDVAHRQGEECWPPHCSSSVKHTHANKHPLHRRPGELFFPWE